MGPALRNRYLPESEPECVRSRSRIFRFCFCDVILHFVQDANWSKWGRGTCFKLLSNAGVCACEDPCRELSTFPW